ncbi:hypothetical protein FBU59_002022 [Linderina macrospora]|uniref:Uncharacterized protein n=1 Tax=Linderina macrospora TaxID=4868 RepID=A0ACC1JCE6_9FUNG|nr:hypothetical protein FBU59_002022 [Linderina macrospora]
METVYGVVRSYARGAQVTLSCQTEGEVIKGDSLWDKTQHGCYVADYYVQTGTSGYVTSKCGSGGGGSSSSGYCKNVNAATLNLIKEFEGFVSKPSPDPIGLPTVGYGHLCQTKGCKEVKYSFPLTKATAEALLKDDIPKYTCIGKYLNSKATLNDYQWGALVSWVFNVGCGNAQSSNLVKRLNAGENPTTVIAGELPKWNKAGGKIMEGLKRRRAAEVKLAQTPSPYQAYPKCS